MSVLLHAVGGVGVFGQNCLTLRDEASGDVLVVDAGAGFPRDGGGGRELLLADPAFAATLRGHIKGYLLTHGHEDHIGALAHWHAQAPAPCFGTPTTLGLVHHRCEDADLPLPEFHPILPGQDLSLGAFHVSALAVSHSIPDSLCFLIENNDVRILHSGDFRVDRDPVVGLPTDMSGLSSLQSRGVDLLLADSTGAVSPGHNPGERSVQPGLHRVFESTAGRIFLTTFASHIQRIQLVTDLSARFGRKILMVGRGALTHSRLAQDLGTVRGWDGLSLSPGEAKETLAGRLTVLLSGCQGEEYSAFWRLAHGDERMPPVQEGDCVVHSARAVPGNEGHVAAILDALARRGGRVVEGREGVHVSGHGYQEDLRELMHAVRPRALIPVHGGHRHLHALADLARQDGMDPEQTPVMENGDVVRIQPHAPPLKVDRLEVPTVLLDDDGQVVPSGPVLGARKELAAGLVVLSAQWTEGRQDVVPRMKLTLHGLSGAARELLEAEAVHEASVSFHALSAQERQDPETVEDALARGVRRVLRRLRSPLPHVVCHAHAEVDKGGMPGAT